MHYTCPYCNTQSKYDGLYDHVLNVDSNRWMFSHDLLNSITCYYVTDPQPSDETIIGIFQTVYTNNGSFCDFPCVRTAVVIWRSFIWLQAFKLLPICVFCDTNLIQNINDNPSGRVKHLVMDGVYVGHHKKYAHMIRNPKYIFRPNYILPNTATGNDRLITNTSIRLLMIRFSIQHLGTIRADWVC